MQVRPSVRAWLTVALALWGCGCVTTTLPLAEGVAVAGAPADFELELDGEAHRLSEWRGRPLVLVLLLTSDVTSQFYIPHLKEAFAQTAGELRFLALTVEPSERAFVDAYVESEELPFPLGVASPDVREGRTSLGLLPLVPATFILDEKGVVRDVGLGVIEARDIHAALRRALGSRAIP